MARSKAKAKTGKAAVEGTALYATDRWKKGRIAHLKEHPLCVDCLSLGLVIEAVEVDHIIPHRGSRRLFFDRTNWQSLCKSCHSRKTAREVFGKRQWGWSIPHDLRPSNIPVTLVIGPPAAGKSTHIRRVAGPVDLVIDLDDIRARLGGIKWDQRPEIFKAAMKERDQLLHGLADRTIGQAWLPIIAADPAEQSAWLSALGSKSRKVIVAPDRATVLRQLEQDPVRIAHTDQMRAQVDQWYVMNP